MRVRRVGRGPLFPDDSPRGERLARRVKGIAIELGAFVALTLLFPFVIAGAALVDLVLWVLKRKHWMAVRLVAMAWWFLFGELQGLLALIGIYISTGGPFGRGSLNRRRMIFGLRIHWCSHHLAGIRTLFGLRFEVEDLDKAAGGPAVVLIRHASIIDNTLSDAFIGREHGMGLRFVIKRELNMIPVIDIGGRWVSTNFVRRGSADAATEVAKLRTLAQNLGEDEAVVIYPEGTRATEEKLARAKALIAERAPDIAPLANKLQNVLPPRLGGPVALLQEARGADVVLFGHVGLDGFEYIRDIWAGGLVGETVKLKFWRFPAAEVPTEEHELTAWLYEHWQLLDDWVGANRA